MADKGNKPRKAPRIRHKKLIMLFSALLVAATVFVIKAFSSKNHALAERGDSFEIPKPATGSPKDYSAKDNLGIAIWTINHGKNFKTNTTGTVVAKVAMINYKQEINNTRIVTDDGMYLETISDSSLVHVYEDKYFQDGQVVIRSKDKKYTTVTDETYLGIYGWLPSEFGAYLIREDTILDCNMEEKDNLYYISLSLNPETSVGKKQIETMKMASSKKAPGYKKCELLLVLNESWQPVELDTKEVYDINMPGLGDITCSGDMVEKFEYGSFEIPDKKEFKTHIGNVSDKIEDAEKGAIDYLQEVFGPLISGKMNDFDLKINALNKDYNGKINIDMSNGIGVNAYIEDIFVNYVGNDLYFKLGENKYKLSIDEVTKHFNNGNKKSDLEKLIDTAILMDQINNSKAVINDDKLTLTLNLELMGIKVNANVYGVKNSDDLFELVNVIGKITINDEVINLELKPSEKYNYPVVDSSYKSINSIFNIIDEAKKLENKALDINLNLDVLDNNINVNMIYDNGLVNGLLTTGDYKASFIYDNDVVYVSFKNFNFKANINDVINYAMKYADGIEMPSAEFSVNDIDINKILDVIKTLAITPKSNNFDLAIDLSKLIDELKLKVNVDYNSGIKISMSDYNLVLTIKEATTKAKSASNEINYIDFNDVSYLIDDITSAINYEAYSAKINLEYDDIKVNGNIYFDKDLNVKANLSLDYSGLTLENIELYYIDNDIYFLYGELNIKVNVNNINELVEAVYEVFSLEHSNSAIPEVELDINSLLDKINLSTDFEGLRINLDLSDLINDFSNLDIKLYKDLDLLVTDNDKLRLFIDLAEEKDLIIEAPNKEYLVEDDIKLIFEYAKGMMDVVEKWRYNMKFDLHVNGYGIYANANIVTLEKGLSLYGKLIIVENEGLENEKVYYAEAYIIENRAYLNFSQTVTNFVAANPFSSTTTKSIKFEIGFDELILTINELLDGLDIHDDTIDMAINYLVKMIDTNGDLSLLAKDISSDAKLDLSMVTSFIDLAHLGITVNETNLKVTFGLNDNSELEYLELTRDNGAIKGLNISNMVLNGDTLNAKFELLDDSDIVSPKETDSKGWLNFDGISKLVKGLLNNYNDGEIDITGSASGKAIGIDLANIKIIVKADIKDLDNIKVFIQIQLPKGLLNKTVFNNSGYTTSIYLTNDSIYVKKITDSKFIGSSLSTETRKMSLSDFNTDLLEQIIWMFDFGDTIADAIRNSESVNPTIEEVLKAFNYDKANDTYSTTLAGDKLVGTSVFGDLNATIDLNDAVKDDPSTTCLNKITVDTKIAGLLTLSATLNVKPTNADFNMNEFLEAEALEAFTAYSIPVSE